MTPKLRTLVLDLIEPVLKWINKVHAPWTHKKITRKMIKQILAVLRPGDIICSTAYGEFTNILIAGKYKHAVIYIGSKTIIEAVNPLVRPLSIYQFLMTKDKVVVCRKKNYDAKICNEAITIAQSAVGKPYDYDFELPLDRTKPNKAFYCAELVWWSYFKADPLMEFKLREVWGVQTVIPDDFIYAKKHWSVVWDSDNKV